MRLSPLQQLCPRGGERERNVSADGSLCCHTLTRILYSFALVFKRLKHRGTSLNGPMLSLHGLDR